MSIEAVDLALEEDRRQKSCNDAISEALKQHDCVLLPLVHLLGAHIPYNGFMVAPRQMSELEIEAQARQRSELCMARIQTLLKQHNCMMVPRIVIQGDRIVENGCIVTAVPRVPLVN